MHENKNTQFTKLAQNKILDPTRRNKGQIVTKMRTFFREWKKSNVSRSYLSVRDKRTRCNDVSFGFLRKKTWSSVVENTQKLLRTSIMRNHH